MEPREEASGEEARGDEATGQDERRIGDRVRLAARVTVRFAPGPISGPGQNISDDGVLFVGEGRIEVEVQVEGEPRPRRGVLVRAQSLDGDKLGMAIKILRDDTA